MRLVSFFVVALIGTTSCFAQDGYGSGSIYSRNTNLPAGKHYFVLLPNAYWDQQNWRDSVYLFPSFQEGRIELKNGFVLKNQPLLNYNVFLELMLIRDEAGNLVPLPGNTDVAAVWVGDRKFIYTLRYGYLEIIHDGDATVAERTTMHGIYELSDGSTYPFITADTRTAVSKYTRYYWQEKSYLIIDKKGRMHLPATPVLAKIFPRKKSEIKTFVKNHKTDFRKREDLLEVVSYCNQRL